jgi:hypothetical protein
LKGLPLVDELEVWEVLADGASVSAVLVTISSKSGADGMKM